MFPFSLAAFRTCSDGEIVVGGMWARAAAVTRVCRVTLLGGVGRPSTSMGGS